MRCESHSIAEEYDSLLAEFDTLTAGMPKEYENPRVTNRTDERANAVAESQILGDQGQSGG